MTDAVLGATSTNMPRPSHAVPIGRLSCAAASTASFWPILALTATERSVGRQPFTSQVMKLSELFFHLTEKSANAKTGTMAVSTSSKATCSPSCPFLPENGGGCYAQSGPLNLHWLKVTAGKRGSDFKTFLSKLRALPQNAAFRHNQAGDLPHTNGRISRLFIRRMVESVKHLKAYTYTHHSLSLGENLALLKYANRNGFTINASCESEQQVDNTIAAGLPAVLVVPSDEERTTWHTKGGNVVLICPAQVRDDKTCADCMLCHKRGRKIAIGFLAHGTGKRKAESNLSSDA